MRPGSKFRRGKIRNSQRGYMLITLMLAVALMTIALLAVLPSVRQQVQREREEELQHRGTAYMRAIQHFYKKFGKYPSRVEELENTNNLRFLRKRYKDPVNRDAEGKEKDFKFLHQQDITLNNGPLLGQVPGQVPGQNPLGGSGFQNQAQNAFGSSAQNALAGAANALGGMGMQPGGIQQTASAAAQSDDNADSGNAGSGSANAGGSSPGSNSGSSSSSGFNGPTFGGGPILGVRSENKKDKSVHVFFQKTHYNDWLFIYVPQGDRGGLLNGPVNPNMPSGNLNGSIPGQPNGAQAPGVVLNPAAQNVPQPQQNPGQTPPDQ